MNNLFLQLMMEELLNNQGLLTESVITSSAYNISSEVPSEQLLLFNESLKLIL